MTLYKVSFDGKKYELLPQEIIEKRVLAADMEAPELSTVWVDFEDWKKLTEQIPDKAISRTACLTEPVFSAFRLFLIVKGKVVLIVDVLPPEYGPVKSWGLEDGGSAEAVVCVRLHTPLYKHYSSVLLGGVKESDADQYDGISDFCVINRGAISQKEAVGCAWSVFSILQYYLQSGPLKIHIKTGETDNA